MRRVLLFDTFIVIYTDAMTFSIINNLTASQNHSIRLKELFSQSDSVLIVSPFLMGDFTDFLSELELHALKKIHLVTTLPPRSFDQIKKINSLVSLIDFPKIKSGEIACQVSLNNKLHGKIYILKNNDEHIAAIVSSANFTDSGLARNHEWGIEFSDGETIAKLEQDILNTLEVRQIEFDQIHRMHEAANDFLNQQPETEERKIDLDLTEHISAYNWHQKLDENIDYFLKPIGYTDAPVETNRLFNRATERLHFSKQRPNGVKPGDILITYGVGTTKILSIYRATSYPLYVSEEEMEEEEWLERWPWYVTAENMTTSYGARWSYHNFTIGGLRQDFLNQYPEGDITAVGGKTLGALQFGKDKLNLSEDFAKFIIEKIRNA